MTAEFLEELQPRKQLETGRGGIGGKRRIANGTGDGGNESNLPVAAIFGKVEPHFIEVVSQYVNWADVHNGEKKKIDIFITDLTIPHGELDSVGNGLASGLTSGVAAAKRITAAIPNANLLYLINPEVCKQLFVLRSSRYRGLLLKSSVANLVKHAIADVSKGIAFRDPGIALRPRMEVDSGQIRIERQLSVAFEENVPDLDSTKVKLQARLRRAWFPPTVKAETLVTMRFSVDGEGMVGAIQVLKSSGSSIADEAAAKTVTRAEPFQGLPAGLMIHVQFNLLAKILP